MEYDDGDKCKIVYSLPEAMVEFSGKKKLKLSLSARQKPICKFILEGQGIFSLDVNKILRLQVTLNSRYVKNVIRYSFFSYICWRAGESRFADSVSNRVFLNRVFLKRGFQPHTAVLVYIRSLFSHLFVYLYFTSAFYTSLFKDCRVAIESSVFFKAFNRRTSSQLFNIEFDGLPYIIGSLKSHSDRRQHWCCFSYGHGDALGVWNHFVRV